MVTKKAKDATIQFRVTPEQRTAFLNKTAEFGGASWVLQQFVAGFLDGRASITPPAHMKELYK